MPLQISDFTIKKMVSFRSAPTVNHILSATAHLLEESSLQEISTNDIAKKAGYAIGTIYKYFPNKHVIIRALAIHELIKRMEGSLVEIEGIIGKPVEYYLERLVEHFETKNSNKIKLYFDLPLFGPTDIDTIRALISKQDLYVRKVFDVIENNSIDCQNSISNEKIKTFSSLFFSFIRKYTILSDRPIDMDERATFIKTLLMIIKS